MSSSTAEEQRLLGGASSYTLKMKISHAYDGYTYTAPLNPRPTTHPEIESSAIPKMMTAPQPIPIPPQNIPRTTSPQPQPYSWFSSPLSPSSPAKELAPRIIPSTPPPTYPLNLEGAATHLHNDPPGQSPTPDIVLTKRLPVYTTSRSLNKSTLPSPCSVDERVLSLPTTHPAAQL